MGEFIPTPDQKKAIEARNGAILVSAGAGSGKTKVLTERLMKYICSESAPDIDRFVIITFTQAAAAELKGRIAAELSEAAVKHPGNGDLRRQQVLIRKAQIGTIHHFCASLLREYSQALSIPANFKIISEERAGEMKSGALTLVLEDSYQNREKYPGFEKLVNSVGIGRDDSGLAKLVLSLYEKMQSHSRPDVWAAGIVEKMGSHDPENNIWLDAIYEYAETEIAFLERDMADALERVRSDEQIRKAYEESFAATYDDLHALSMSLRNTRRLPENFTELRFPRLGVLKKAEDTDTTEKVKARRDLCKKKWQKLAPLVLMDRAEAMDEMAQCTPAMNALLDLVGRFTKEYAEEKLRGGFLDYSDLEHKAALLLLNADGTPTECARSISARYTEIMVDEYQDVSHVQDDIFRAVSDGGKKLFMVGDVKQSIYRFRLADPEIFNEKYRTFADCGTGAEGEPRKIFLKDNFRSRKGIISCANAVFGMCMTKILGDVDYDENAALKFGARGYQEQDPIPQVLLCGPAADETGNTDRKTIEAAFVARKIADFVASGAKISDGSGGMRPVEYGDIAILLRSANSVGGIYRQELTKLGIPVVTGQGGTFFEAREVSLVMSMLEILDNPHKDIPLLSVLSSPLFGFTPDELAFIREESEEADLYTALLSRAEKNEKCENFVKLLKKFRKQCPDLSADEIVWMLCEETGLRMLCSALPDGEQRNENLMQLIRFAGTFEADGAHGVHAFVQWLKRMEKKGAEVPNIGGNASSVKIMSIHRSKGLEFPVVFLSSLTGEFNRSDTMETVLVHPELGLGPSFVDEERKVIYPTAARTAIALRLKRETLSEEMRLLYVALTRPKEYLFMTGYAKHPEEYIERIRRKVPTDTGVPDPEDLCGCQSMMEWIVAAAMADGNTHLKISCEEFRTDEKTAEEIQERNDAEEETETLQKLKERLEFRYAHAGAEELPSKVTATELKEYERTEQDEYEEAQPMIRQRSFFPEPDFMKENRPATGAEKGIATHLALQYMDILKENIAEHVPEEIERLRQGKFLSDRQARSVNVQAIRNLFLSETGRRILHADAVRREFKFSILCSAEEIFGGAEGEEILLQGVVDCCLEERGEIVIIDYKTDYVRTESDVEEKCGLYASQLRSYARALRRILEKPVKECILYFLSNSTARTFPADKEK